MDYENQGKMQNRKSIKIGIILILFLIGLLVGFYFTFQFSKGNPKKIFESSIEEVSSALLKNTKTEASTFLKGNLTLKTNLESQEESLQQIFTILNKMDFHYQYACDLAKTEAEGEIGITYNHKDFTSILFYLKQKDGYFSFKNLFDKYIHVPLEISLNDVSWDDMNLSKKDMEVILNHLQQAIQKSLKKEYFKVENEKIVHDGKTISANKNILILDEKNTKEMARSIIESLNTTEFITSFSHLVNVSEEEIKKVFDEFDENETIKEFSKTSTLSIYTKPFSHEFLGFEFKEEQDILKLIKDGEYSMHYSFTIEGKTYTGKMTLQEKENVYSFLLELDGEIHGSIQMDFSYETEGSLTFDSSKPIIEVENFNEKEMQKIFENLMNNEAFQNFAMENASLLGDLNSLLSILPKTT